MAVRGLWSGSFAKHFWKLDRRCFFSAGDRGGILPVFTLVDQEGRLFCPLALSKNLAMAIAALLA